MKKYYPGNIVEAKVIGLKPYGVFVDLGDGILGLIHISEISENFVSNIYKMFSVGEIVKSKILDIDYKEKKVKLSLKAIGKRNRYRQKKCSFSEEKIQVEKEFFAISVRMDDFIKDAKEMLDIC